MSKVKDYKEILIEFMLCKLPNEWDLFVIEYLWREMKDELAFIEKCKAEKAHLLTLTNETEIESTLKDVEYYIESNNLAIFKDNNPIGKRQYQLTDLGKKLKELKTFEALEKYCEKEKFKEEEKRELELIKLRREVYFLRDPRYWLGVASGAITTAIAIIGIYLAWLHR